MYYLNSSGGPKFQRSITGLTLRGLQGYFLLDAPGENLFFT